MCARLIYKTFWYEICVLSGFLLQNDKLHIRDKKTAQNANIYVFDNFNVTTPLLHCASVHTYRTPA